MGKKNNRLEAKIEVIGIRLDSLEEGMLAVSNKINRLMEKEKVSCYPSKCNITLSKQLKEKQKDLKIVSGYIHTLSLETASIEEKNQKQEELDKRMEARGTDFCVDGRVVLSVFNMEKRKMRSSCI